MPDKGGSHFNLASDNRDVRQSTVSYYKHCADLCGVMGIDHMTIHPGQGFLNKPMKNAFDCAVEAMQQVAEHALSRGVVPAVLHGGANFAPSFKRTLELLNAINLTGVKIVLDANRAWCDGEDLEGLLSSHGEISLIQLSDGPEGPLALGDGRIPVKTLCSVINDAGYAGRVVLNLDNRRYVMDPGAAVAKTAETINSWT